MTVIYEKGFDQTIEKSDGTVPNGQDDLFTITGGPILVTEFVGIVTTNIQNSAVTCHLDLAVTTPSADVALSTTVAITNNAAGTSYTFSTADPAVLTPTTAGALEAIPRIAWLCPIGTIKAHFSAARTGAIKWYMKYTMLSQYSKVVAAA